MKTSNRIFCVMVALIALLPVPGNIAFADDPAPSFKAKCKLADHEFEISFDSKSGDPLNDDMAISFRDSKKTARLALKAGLYYPKGVTTEKSTPASICDTIPGFEIDAHRALLFLTRDQRPGYPVLSLALVDVSKGELLNAYENVAEFKQGDSHTRYVARKGKTGFHTRLVREVLKNTGSDGPENYIEDWNVIEVHGHHIIVGWRDPLKKCE